MLTPEQRAARSALADDFRKRIVAAVWEGIEAADQSLLCADDGTPYGETKGRGGSVLDDMAADAAVKAVDAILAAQKASPRLVLTEVRTHAA